jgi:diguanylate cyclase (GGDEF)-like protein
MVPAVTEYGVTSLWPISPALRRAPGFLFVPYPIRVMRMVQSTSSLVTRIVLGSKSQSRRKPRNAMDDPPTLPDSSSVPLSSVIATDELFRRPSRPPDYEAENRALAALAQELASSPQGISQKLVEASLTLCHAHSSGISLLAEEQGKKIFRWAAIAGDWAPHVGGVTPRDFSPCGVVLDRNSVQLFVRFDRYYPYFSIALRPTHEALLIPFHVEGEAVGTVWVVSHDESRKFDAEDVRLLTSVGQFASAAFTVLTSLEMRTKAEASLRTMTLKMSHLAQHDFLTDLPNRMLLNDLLSHSISLARRHGKRLAILFLDLDHLKHINDSLGHPIGDQLLTAVALRLVACVRGSDTVSRQGGDEFVVLLSEIEHAEDAAFTAEKMRAAVMAPYSIANHDLHLSASIGISIYPDDGGDAETLIKSADTAMYHAKDSGRNNYQFFRHDMNVRAVERQFVEGSLRRALERHEFVLNYQPKVNLETGTITGAEALIRWRHPDRGLIFPAQFIAIAEESGLIVPIGQWVLREACMQARAWIDSGLQVGQMAVNISAVEFRSKGFFEGVCAILKETHLEARYLELELTESVLMSSVASTSAVLQALSAMRIRLAVDDFGTGYSSLSYLKQFPIDTLKIDQSFVHDVTTDASDATIVSTVIAMGKSLKQRVIAEGVETSEQLAFLQSRHCGEGQGYYFSHPVPANEFATLLATGV